MIILERAQFVRQYPEIATATFLEQEKQYLSNLVTTGLSHETGFKTELVIYVGSPVSDSGPDTKAETLYLQDLCELYQEQQTHVREMPSRVLIIAGRDICIHHTMGQGAGQKKISFWALEGANIRVFCAQAKLNSDTQIYCYGAANSSIQIDMLVRASEQNSHSSVVLKLYPEGPHAQMRVRGAYLLKDEQTVRISVLQNHAVPNTATDVIIKGIVQDNAQAYYDGLIFIDKNAPHTNARQENKNIILGVRAVADSRPKLEVLNHEVSCAHGSAVGQLDPDQLFYLASRGLDPECAQELLLDGFIGDLFDHTALSVLGEIKTGEIKT